MSVGLSVWMWGPHLWDFLHTLAKQIDQYPDQFEASSVVSFLVNLQPLLPCRYCRDSYGPFLQEVQDARNEPLEACIRNRHMVAFMYDLHNKINAKLAGQKWDATRKILLEKHRGETFRDIINDSELRKMVLVEIDKKPSLNVVLKRGLFLTHQPFNLEGVLLLIKVLFQRTVQHRPNLLEFIAMFQHSCSLIDNRRLVQLSNTEITENTMDRILFAYSETMMPFNTFLQEIKEKLALMEASACGGGTCV